MTTRSSVRQRHLATAPGRIRVGLALGMYPRTEQTMFWVSKLFQDSTTRMDKWSARYIVMVNIILMNNHRKLKWWNQLLVSCFWLSLASAQLLWIRFNEKHYRKHRNWVAYVSRLIRLVSFVLFVFSFRVGGASYAAATQLLLQDAHFVTPSWTSGARNVFCASLAFIPLVQSLSAFVPFRSQLLLHSLYLLILARWHLTTAAGVLDHPIFHQQLAQVCKLMHSVLGMVQTHLLGFPPTYEPSALCSTNPIWVCLVFFALFFAFFLPVYASYRLERHLKDAYLFQLAYSPRLDAHDPHAHHHADALAALPGPSRRPRATSPPAQPAAATAAGAGTTTAAASATRGHLLQAAFPTHTDGAEAACSSSVGVGAGVLRAPCSCAAHGHMQTLSPLGEELAAGPSRPPNASFHAAGDGGNEGGAASGVQPGAWWAAADEAERIGPSALQEACERWRQPEFWPQQQQQQQHDGPQQPDQQQQHQQQQQDVEAEQERDEEDVRMEEYNRLLALSWTWGGLVDPLQAARQGQASRGRPPLWSQLQWQGVLAPVPPTLFPHPLDLLVVASFAVLAWAASARWYSAVQQFAI